MDYSTFTFRPYEYQHYPRWIDGVLVNSEEEELALKEKEAEKPKRGRPPRDNSARPDQSGIEA